MNRFFCEGIRVDSSTLVRSGTLEVVLPVERFQGRRFRAFREFGRVEDLEEGSREGDEGRGALDDTEEGSDEVESEWVVSGSRDQSASKSRRQSQLLFASRVGVPSFAYRIAPRATWMRGYNNCCSGLSSPRSASLSLSHELERTIDQKSTA